jgi:microcystin-dependent protein
MPYIGEVRLFAGNYAPTDWILCDGRALDIATYDVLYALIGTTYGGDGVNYFNVPDLRSRIPVGMGTASWGTTYSIGQTGGTETNTLNTSTMPAHSHSLTGATVSPLLVSSEDGHKTTPGGNYPAVNGQTIYSTTTDSAKMPVAVNLTTSGSGVASPQPFTNVQPYITVNYIICAFGIYPTQ